MIILTLRELDNSYIKPGERLFDIQDLFDLIDIHFKMNLFPLTLGSCPLLNSFASLRPSASILAFAISSAGNKPLRRFLGRLRRELRKLKFAF